ncbi:YerC/YecD family TrpR-related protein [Propionispora vibrioides]|uniref:TrpR-related protein YerC/YecD n=1 Tax=Propionispora vibrioides TaxID=112903 RepID=A0A1H8T9H7_9FIRM|nr:YerC/YecD family TrpR-related protein [Propionispora vibrioides]SEO87710.1 TrpR-related protein YerC/YecD [Propionispora vibrioides]
MPVNPKLKDPLIDQLFQAILLLQDEEECYQFFEDVSTIGELKSLAQRLEVARMLQLGSTYDDIVARTGASTATISRVKRCLNYGADGYGIVLSRLDEKGKE